MLNSTTLLVLGAGASKEVGFPLGLELRNKLSSMLDIGFEWREQLRGDRMIGQHLVQLANKDQASAQRMQDAGRKVVRKLPQVSSIDALLSLLEDADAVAMTKIAITVAIANAERGSFVHSDKKDFSAGYFDRLSQTWYGKFFELLNQRVIKSRVVDIFENLTVISFNYDRSFEEFLFRALINLYDLTAEGAADVMGRLRIVHPYGTISPLTWQASTGTDFGSVPALENAESLIQTFSEQFSDKVLQRQIDSAVNDCERVVFLGFGYIPENMEILAPKGQIGRKPLRGTAFGFSQSNELHVEETLDSWLEPSNDYADEVRDPSVVLDRSLTCAQYVDSFSRFLLA